MPTPIIQSTTPSIDGKRITRYCGIVTGEAIMGANVFKDLVRRDPRHRRRPFRHLRA